MKKAGLTVMDVSLLPNENMDYEKKLKKKVYSHLSKNFDHDVVERLLETAVVSMEGYINAIETDMECRRIQGLLNKFHAFQGMLANLGLEAEAKRAKEIQKHLQQGILQPVTAEISVFVMDMSHFSRLLQIK